MTENTTQYGGATYSYGTRPTPPKPKRWYTRPALALTAALLVGAGAGAGAGSSITAASIHGHCNEALGYAESALSSAGKAFGYVSDAMSAMSTLNFSGAKTAASNIGDETAAIKAVTPQYQAAKAACTN